MGTTGLQLTLWFIYLGLLVGSLSQTANDSHIGRVCTTWGNYHWKTFDGDFFQLASTCNHVLASQCKGSYENFNIQMRREILNNIPTISEIIMKVEGSVVQISKTEVIVNDQTVTLPLVKFGMTISGTTSSITVEAKLGVRAIWNLDDSLDIEIDNKYRSQICGLCGNFDGVSDDLVKDGVPVSVSDFAETYKVNGPTESCEEPRLNPVLSCGDKSSPENVSMQAASPNNGGTLLFATSNVHTTWNSWSVAALVLTAAPTLRPVVHVTATAMMAAAALLEWSLMTSVTLAVLQWISVLVCTMTKSTSQDSLTLTTVDLVCVRVDSGNVRRRTVQESVLWREEPTSTPLMGKSTPSMGTVPTS
ncbi:hypothetical protein PAMP_001037 [Pampus punctatissimus]